MFIKCGGPLLRQYIVVITVNLTMIAAGMGLMWPSPVFVKLRDKDQTILPEPITEEQGSWIVSVGFLTGIFGNFMAAYLVDRIGRKLCIIIGCLPKFIAGFLFLYAYDVWMLLVGRALLGIADAFVFIVVPMYASEVSSKEIRGALGTILQVVCSTGVLIMFSMGPFVSYWTLNVIFASVVVATTMPLILLPDSPYFLYSKGLNHESLKVLTFLRGTETLAIEEIKEYSLLDNNIKIPITQIFKNKIFLKSFFIVFFIVGWVHLLGFNTVSFYLQTILDSTQTSVQPEIASVIVGVIQILSSIVTTFITDRFGRKPILTTTLSAQAVGMVGLGVFFKLQEHGKIEGVLNFLPLMSLVLIVFGYSAGVGSLNWILCAELFDDAFRGVGLSLSGIISYISLFTITKYFSALTLAIGPSYTYWLFSVNCVILCVFIGVVVPETKGKTFSEIQRALGAKDKVKDVQEKC
ncbi:hypothetical protein K1T71_013501 [Dendrolimus kikuchii]|uniref:Uncharacterized protein n=1 Tax=Dendrolimus kikuchii TaxID=765133 RepID=A0ACC1CGN3_9NEOP|nr:hypothetical protein K1T71_013501 [Dendrolimus kikuchii]